MCQWTHSSLFQRIEVEQASDCCSGFAGLVDSASWGTGMHSVPPLRSGNRHWDCRWLLHSCQEHCWALLGVLPSCWPAVGGAADSDFRTAAGDVVGSGGCAAGGTEDAVETDHGSTDLVALGSAKVIPAEGMHVGECCCPTAALGAFSSLRPSPYACCR